MRTTTDLFGKRPGGGVELVVAAPIAVVGIDVIACGRWRCGLRGLAGALFFGNTGHSHTFTPKGGSFQNFSCGQEVDGAETQKGGSASVGLHTRQAFFSR